MKKILNFIGAHKQSKCPGSYRKGVVFDSSGSICRMFSLKNKVFKTQEIKRLRLFICLSILRHQNWTNILKISIQFSTQVAEKKIKISISLRIRIIIKRI
jgi:hypothetical protein